MLGTLPSCTATVAPSGGTNFLGAQPVQEPDQAPSPLHFRHYDAGAVDDLGATQAANKCGHTTAAAKAAASIGWQQYGSWNIPFVEFLYGAAMSDR